MNHFHFQQRHQRQQRQRPRRLRTTMQQGGVETTTTAFNNFNNLLRLEHLLFLWVLLGAVLQVWWGLVMIPNHTNSNNAVMTQSSSSFVFLSTTSERSLSSSSASTLFLRQQPARAQRPQRRQQGQQRHQRLTSPASSIVTAPAPRMVQLVLRLDNHHHDKSSSNNNNNKGQQQQQQQYYKLVDTRPVSASARLRLLHQGRRRITKRSVPPLSNITVREYKYFYRDQEEEENQKWDSDDCQILAPDWNSSSFHPVCNLVQEFNFFRDDDSTSSKQWTLLGRGNFRHAWKIVDFEKGSSKSSSEGEETFCLRTLRFSLRHFEARDVEAPKLYQQHNLEAMALDRLSSRSHRRHGIRPYAFCGHSLLTELGVGTLRQQYVLPQRSQVSDRQRLVVGQQVAQALADIHSLHAPNCRQATLAHGDFHRQNILVTTEGRLVVNDFNQAILLRGHTQNNHDNKSNNNSKSNTRSCRYSNYRFFGLPTFGRPPERFNESSFVDAAAVDVFGLGCILAELATRIEPWHELTTRRVQRQPRVWKVHRKYVDQTQSSLELRALLWAARACFAFDPNDRPTACRVAQGLDTVLEWTKKSVTRNDGINNTHHHSRLRTKQHNVTDVDQELQRLFSDRNNVFCDVEIVENNVKIP